MAAARKKDPAPGIDARHCVMVFDEPITSEDAQRIGKAVGSLGYTGVFVLDVSSDFFWQQHIGSLRDANRRARDAG